MLEKVKARVVEVQKLLSKIGYPAMEITSSVKSLKAGCAGLARPHKKEIAISSDYLREHESETMQRTVAHEVCHVYVAHYFPFAKQAHGPEFRRLMNLLRLDSSTCHSMKLQNGPVRRKNTKIRYIYVSSMTNSKVRLTAAQHKKALMGVKFTFKGQAIKFTGQSETFV